MSVLYNRISEGGLFPKYHGWAWTDHYSYSYVTLPVPFNIIARHLRSAWIFLKGKRRTHEDGIFQRGYEMGKEYGLQAVERDYETEISKLEKEISRLQFMVFTYELDKVVPPMKMGDIMKFVGYKPDWDKSNEHN